MVGWRTVEHVSCTWTRMRAQMSHVGGARLGKHHGGTLVVELGRGRRDVARRVATLLVPLKQQRVGGLHVAHLPNRVRSTKLCLSNCSDATANS